MTESHRRISHIRSVPRLCGYFLPQGRETTNLNKQRSGQRSETDWGGK